MILVPHLQPDPRALHGLAVGYPDQRVDRRVALPAGHEADAGILLNAHAGEVWRRIQAFGGALGGRMTARCGTISRMRGESPPTS